MLAHQIKEQVASRTWCKFTPVVPDNKLSDSRRGVGYAERTLWERHSANKLFLKKKYCRCEMKEGESWSGHLKGMKRKKLPSVKPVWRASCLEKHTSQILSKRKLQLIHSDVCGLQTESTAGAKDFVTFTEDSSRCCKVNFLKHKSQLLSPVSVDRKSPGWEQIMVEYTSSEFQEYLKAQGLHHEMTVPHTPRQNAAAERKTGDSLKQLEVCCLMLSYPTCPEQRL